jgi:hypothetical protein
MGLLVAGYDGENPLLLHVSVAQGNIQEIREPLACGGVVNDPNVLLGTNNIDPASLSIPAAAALGETLILDVAKRASQQVGPPVQIILVTRAGTRRLK